MSIPRLRTLAACLAAALVLTVAPAWLAECFWTGTPSRLADVGGSWHAPVPEDWPVEPQASGTMTQRLRVRTVAGDINRTGQLRIIIPAYDNRYLLDTIYSGWPVRVLKRRGPQDDRPVPAGFFRRLAAYGVPIGIQSDDLTGADRRIPLIPVWEAFAATWLAWSGGLIGTALLASGFRGARSVWWRKRSRCAGCGYVLLDMDVCPECGRQAASDCDPACDSD